MLKNSVLPEIVSIQATSLHNFNNVMHTQFHSDQYDLVAKVEAAKLNLPADLLARWKKSIDLEIELNKQTALSTLTKDLDAKNHDRNKTLMQFFALIRAYRLSLVGTESRSAEDLYAVLKPYLGIQKEMGAVESTHISGLIKDTEKFSAEITKLGLTPVLDRLKTLNEDYKKLNEQRRLNNVDTKLPGTRTVRRETDATFAVICQCVQAAYLLAANNDDKKLVLQLVDRMNRISADLKTKFKASAVPATQAKVRAVPTTARKRNPTGTREKPVMQVKTRAMSLVKTKTKRVKRANRAMATETLVQKRR